MKFCATRYEPDGDFAEYLEADTWPEAEAICKREGWLLMGLVKAEIPEEHVQPGDSLSLH